MNQPVASVTSADVERLVVRDFTATEHAAVWALLISYGTESHERDVDRVRAAVLRIADGQVKEVESAVRVAKQDYRDALVAAEYPLYWQRTGATRALRELEKAEVYEADRKQYEDWFHRRAR